MGIQFYENGVAVPAVSDSNAITLNGVGTSKVNIGNVKIGDNLDGITLTEFIRRIVGGNNKLSFLHISDTHGQTNAINKCGEVANADSSIAAMIHTGDFSSASFNAMRNLSLSSAYKLAVWGNHDTYDTYSKDSAAAANAIRTLISTSAIYGKSTASYWYKDIVTEGGGVVRFIGFDEYEKASSTSSLYQVYYTKEQIDWFISLLKSTPSSYGIVLIHHEFVQNGVRQNESGQFKSVPAASDTKRTNFHSGPADDTEIIPAIMDAYKKKTSFSKNMADTDGSSVAITANFADCNPATLYCHIGGHYHADVCEWHVTYPDQLILFIGKADKSVSSGYNDLTFDDYNYCIDKVTLDLDAKSVTIDRIGASAKNSGESPAVSQTWNV